MIEEKTLGAQNRGSLADSTKLPRVCLKILLLCLLLSLLKLWLIHSEEIVARYLPHDDLWYIQSAKEWYWLGPYNGRPFQTPPFIRLPAYPLYIALTAITGIPLRISIELLLLVAAFAFIVSLIKAGQSQILCVALFAFIIFHPASSQVNKYSGTDSFYGPILLLALASIIILLVKRNDSRRFWYALLAGLALAVLWHVRQESILILGLLAAYALISLLLIREPGKTWRVILKQFGIVVMIPAVVLLAVSLIVQTLNFVKYGVFAPDAMSISGYKAASNALLRIKPVVPMRYVPVPREVRMRAYNVSPAFRELETYMEGQSGNMWAGFATDAGVQFEGEISAGHFPWALNHAALIAGYDSAPKANDFYQRVADEINAACNDGRLQCRFALSSHLDPHTQNYLPHLSASFLRVSRWFFEEYEPPKETDALSVTPDVRRLFDAVANRRSALTSFGTTNISGWAFNLEDELQKVVARAPGGQVLASIDTFSPRPDLVQAYAKDGVVVPLNTGYGLNIPLVSSQELSADIVFISKSGAEAVVHREGKLFGIGVVGATTYAVDSDQTFTISNERETSVYEFISHNYRRLNVLLTYLGLAAFFILLLCYKFLDLREPIYAIVVLLAVTIITRLAFFALLDASAYYADQLRYLYPIIYLYTCTLALICAQAISVAARRLNFSRLTQKWQLRRDVKRTSDQSV